MKKIIILILILLGISGCTKLKVENESYAYPDSENKLIAHFLDVGQGDSNFIVLPNKETMLIDAGESKSSEKIISYIKKLGYQKIDYVIATHPHADHIGGLKEVIENFDIGAIHMPKVVATSKTYENLLTAIKEKGLKINSGAAGVKIFDTDNLEIRMVAPNQTKYSGFNNYSIILKIRYGKTSFLYTGDAEKLSESEITEDIKSDVLKVGHHGSDTSSSVEFLDKIKPKYAVISVGANNKYGHPAEVTLNNLKKYTKNIYRTDVNGNIIITSDGKNIIVEKER